MTDEIKEAIEKVKAKLSAENTDPKDYYKCIQVLSRCVAPVYCLNIYKNYIYSYEG